MKEALHQYFAELKEDLKVLAKAYKEKHMTFPKDKGSNENASLLEFLPYRSYSPESGIFENKNTLGFILRVSHFSGINEQAKQVIRSAILEVPANYTVQVINYASPKIGKLLDYWFESSKRGEIFKKISEKRRDFFKRGAWNSILGNRKNLVVRNFELYISFSVTKSEFGKLDSLASLMTLKEKVMHTLRGINCEVIALNQTGLLSFVSEIINPTYSLYKSESLESHQDIRNNFVSSHHQVEMHKDKVLISNLTESFHYLTFEVVDCPNIWRLENSVNYVGQFDSGNSLPCPFYISFGFKLEAREKSERTADKYRMLKTKQGDSKLPMFFPKMIEEIEDWRYVSSRVSGGERLGQSVMYIVLCIKDPKDLDRYEQITRDHFARLRFKIEKVRYDTLNPLLHTLPFGIGESWQIQEQLKISSKKLSDACMSLLPVFADQQNYGSPLMLFVGPRGQLFYFDCFKTAEDANGNFNISLVGISGSGKSVWLQEYTVSILRFGGQLIIIDDGRSFEKASKLLEGDFIDFGGGNFCINPFSLYRDVDFSEKAEEYKEFFEEPFIDLIVSILCIIANIDKNNTNDPEIGLYKAVMSHAVAEVIAKKKGDGGFADIRDELINNQHIRGSQTKEIADKLEYILQPYSYGRYAGFFNGKATINISNKLTVFELSDLEHNQILQNSVLLTVVFLVYSKMRGRERMTSLIIDEAWKLLAHPSLKSVIEGITRRARKYNGNTVVASQRLSDFDRSKSEAAAAVLSQSAWKVMLSVEGGDNEIMKNELGMSDGEISVAKGLCGLKGAYSEFMIRHQSGSWQIGRLLLDPFSAKLYSTTAEDVVAIRKMKEQGLSIESAVEALIEKRT
jgi:conjugal transfer ATP-binding protein TraC